MRDNETRNLSKLYEAMTPTDLYMPKGKSVNNLPRNPQNPDQSLAYYVDSIVRSPNGANAKVIELPIDDAKQLRTLKYRIEQLSLQPETRQQTSALHTKMREITQIGNRIPDIIDGSKLNIGDILSREQFLKLRLN